MHRPKENEYCGNCYFWQRSHGHIDADAEVKCMKVPTLPVRRYGEWCDCWKSAEAQKQPNAADRILME